MSSENIDYEDLKSRGFLRQKQEGFFLLRVRMSGGVFKKAELDKIAEISQKFGQGFVHATTRQGLEIPFIKFEDIEKVEMEIKAGNIVVGTSGARLRTTTACPGNNWCKQGLIDTFALASRIENELGIKCGLNLPHKFKIAISGCPNTCTRPQNTEIGIHGAVEIIQGQKRFGFAVYLGGCGGKTPRKAIKLEKIFTEVEVLVLIKRVVEFFKNNAKPRQRLAVLIEEIGWENFLKEIMD